jgi:membrane-associated phospholipid phosphatase
MIDLIFEIDRDLFEFLNGKLSHKFLDFLMPWVTNAYTWIPLYVGILVYFIYRYKTLFYIPFLGLLLTFGACDYVSSGIIKPKVNRVRPCNDTTVTSRVVGVSCRNSPGFPSSHAANHFGIATFMIFLMGTRKRFGLGFWLWWASIIAFSRIYVGVHFPLDVIAGAFLGIFFGAIIVYPVNKILRNKS